MTNEYTFKRKQIVTAPAEEVFSFFSNPFNLRQVTPPQCQLQLLHSYPVIMNDGLHLKFKFKKYGISFFWESEIIDWNPLNKTFTEQQVKGPFQSWRHHHAIRAVNSDITEILDDITYTLPYGQVGHILHSLWIKQEIHNMFHYRFLRLAEWFRPISASAGEKKRSNFRGSRNKEENMHGQEKMSGNSRPYRRGRRS